MSEADKLALRALPKTMPWVKRASEIHKLAPSVKELDWKKLFDEDEDVLGALLRDILRLGAPRNHTWGPRDMPDRDEALATLRRWRGEDHATAPFIEAFSVLASDLSSRQLARKIGISRAMVVRLQTGEVEPDSYLLELIARAFKKAPGYFTEYRVIVIANALAKRFGQSPESSINFYRRICSAEAEAAR